MRIKLFISAGVLAVAGFVVAGATPALAGASEVTIFPYATAENFCPTGLQPITISGVICCGKPNTNTSYQQMIGQSTRQAWVRTASTRRTVCPVGEKGCVTR
ncbi:MAG: hypothetical protein Q9M48_14280 [Rhodobacterales bacterium]|nr:hypothetical protein [Rhodobacterales bacterium]